jgi:hypothetical protein
MWFSVGSDIINALLAPKSSSLRRSEYIDHIMRMAK